MRRPVAVIALLLLAGAPPAHADGEIGTKGSAVMLASAEFLSLPGHLAGKWWRADSPSES